MRLLLTRQPFRNTCRHALACVGSLLLIAINTALLVAPWFFWWSPAVAADQSVTVADVSQMTIDELMELEIRSPAAITAISSKDAPASITVITADDIKHTPARNIYDLIEAYVPGAIWFDHENGPV